MTSLISSRSAPYEHRSELSAEPVHLIQIDIEGFEFVVLNDLIKQFEGRPLPFGQLQLEIHAWNKSFQDFLVWWEGLEAAGLRPFYTEPNLVYLNLFPGRAPDLSEV